MIKVNNILKRFQRLQEVSRQMLSAAIALIVALGLYFVFVSVLFGDMTSRGQFGDMFGGINSFFAGLAATGVILTLRQQHKEIVHNQNEQERIVKIQEETSSALKAQAESSKNLESIARLRQLLEFYMRAKVAATRMNSESFNATQAEIDMRLKRITDICNSQYDSFADQLPNNEFNEKLKQLSPEFRL